MKYDFGHTSHPDTTAVSQFIQTSPSYVIFIRYWWLAIYQKIGALSEQVAATLENHIKSYNYQHLNDVSFKWRSPADCHIVNGLIYSSKNDSIAICISIGPGPGSCSCKQVSGDLHSTHTPA